ncbi:hypothetical protein HOG21_04855 [bacterium]|jgi:hypothetical protein|nr:hypothetical protein [bacterium]
MTTLKLNIPNNLKSEYESILANLIEKFSLNELKQIEKQKNSFNLYELHESEVTYGLSKKLDETVKKDEKDLINL